MKISRKRKVSTPKKATTTKRKEHPRTGGDNSPNRNAAAQPGTENSLADPRLQQILDAVNVRLVLSSKLSATDFEFLRAVAINTALDIRKTEQPTSWEDAEHVRITTLRALRHLGIGGRVVAHIARFPPPSRIESTVVGTVLTLRGIGGEMIETLGIVGDAAIAKLDALRPQGLVEFLVRPVTVPNTPSALQSSFLLDVIDARRTTSALDMLGATRAERAAVEALLRGLRARGASPLDYLQAEVERGLGVVGLDGLPLLRQLLRFTVLQALSVGRIGNAPGKLHVVVVGPPAQGKKLVGLAARILNPTWQEASPSKISPAGLVGASSHSPQGWKSQPGLIPQADGGVVILQDAHAVQKSKIHILAPVLQELIEDGVVRDSVAGGVRREVSVGLVIDLNRLGQVSSTRSEAPILSIRPLLSRVDLLAEIAPDPQQAWRASAELYATLGAKAGALDDEVWVRRARLLVAALRDRHVEIDLDSVCTAMRDAHERIDEDNQEFISAQPEAGDIPMRLAISFGRFVTASARAHDRAAATAEDVQEALHFLRLKLEHFKMQVHVDDGTQPRSSFARIERLVRERFSDGRAFDAEDLRKLYADATGEIISGRTARRWIDDLGARRVGWGRYALSDDDRGTAAAKETG